jgi:hypothetical protein
MSPLTLALRTGELPGLIDPKPWLRQLERRRGVLRQVQGVGGVVFTLFGFGELLVLLTSDGNPAPQLVFAGVFFAVAIAAGTVPARQFRRIDALEEKIRATYPAAG